MLPVSASVSKGAWRKAMARHANSKDASSFSKRVQRSLAQSDGKACQFQGGVMMKGNLSATGGVLVAMCAACALFCHAQEEEGKTSRHALQVLNERIREFEDSGRKRSQLVEMSRKIIREMDAPPWASAQRWRLEVPKVMTSDLEAYLKDVWSVRSIEVRRDCAEWFLLVQLDDRVSVVVYSGDVLPDPALAGSHGHEVVWGDGVKLARKRIRR
jgi:hypothetical protein